MFRTSIYRNTVVTRILTPAALLALSIAAFASDPFTIAAFPDTQVYNRHPAPNLWTKQAVWAVENKERLNIVFATHLGDFTDDGPNTEYWKNAESGTAAMDGKLPYSISFGNHDLHQETGPALCKKFGTPKHEGAETFGGASPDGLSSFQIIKAGDFKILHLNLKFNPEKATIAWAQQTIDANPGMPIMISTHTYLDVTGLRDGVGKKLWESLVKVNPRIFMVINGHYHGEAQMLSANDAGKKVSQMIVDYQGGRNGGDAFLRTIRFVPDAGLIELKTYSPSLDTFKTEPSCQFAYDATFDAKANTIEILGLHGLPRDYVAPFMTKLPKPQKAVEGERATFSALADGTGPITYQWFRNGAKIANATSPEYTTQPVTMKDDGAVFTVLASNAAGSVRGRADRASKAILSVIPAKAGAAETKTN